MGFLTDFRTASEPTKQSYDDQPLADPVVSDDPMSPPTYKSYPPPPAVPESPTPAYGSYPPPPPIASPPPVDLDRPQGASPDAIRPSRAASAFGESYQDQWPSAAEIPVALPPQGDQAYDVRYYPAPIATGSGSWVRRLVGGGVITALLAAALVAALVLMPKHPQSAQAAVIASVDHAFADRTADLTMSVTETSASGASISGTGSGTIDFSKGDLSLLLSMDQNGQTLTVPAEYLGGVVYEKVPGLEAVDGKPWISLDLSSVATKNPGVTGTGANPVAALHLYATQGDQVIPIGNSVVDGTPVTGYAIDINTAKLNAELAQADLPSWMHNSSLATATQFTGSVYVDHNGILRQYGVHYVSSIGTVDEVLDFSNYGASVEITAPPPADVTSFQQLLQGAGS